MAPAKKSTKTTTKSNTTINKTVSPEPVLVEQAPTKVEEPQVETKLTKKEETNNEFVNLIEELETMKKQITKIMSTVKVLQKTSAKKNRNQNIKSGFVKPVAISKEMGVFMGTKENELVPRNVVNKTINEYIKNHNLQVPTDKQTFVLDDTLASLFNLKNGDVVHYFKMQTHLKNHYPKAVEV